MVDRVQRLGVDPVPGRAWFAVTFVIAGNDHHVGAGHRFFRGHLERHVHRVVELLRQLALHFCCIDSDTVEVRSARKGGVGGRLGLGICIP